jgi:N utilization substance protein B
MSSARRRSRELALQGLYQWQYTGADAAQLLGNLAELEAFPQADGAFLEAELRGVIGASDELRGHLEPLADRKWDEVSPIERGILLIGAWELLHCPEIPYRATINEAIELGKRFGGTDGHKYVNGVLDRLAHAVRPREVAAPRPAARGGRRPPRSPGNKADA